MVEKANKVINAPKRALLTPMQLWLSASSMLALIIVPASIGMFYIFELAKHLFKQPLQYSAVYGLIFGIVLSLIAGYFYSRIARKRIEKD
ncbi:MAG: hypothetical protein QCI82_06450 [Candidatus Thermoplasmatota archaeon]|nr:hypothetical protein [Candidatus Thermoplasmatota archaeon]